MHTVEDNKVARGIETSKYSPLSLLVGANAFNLLDED
jgi:hypothetical protein